MKQKENIFFGKKNQNGQLKKPPPKAEKCLTNFNRLVLGLVGLIEAKGINVTQAIWLSGYGT